MWLMLPYLMIEVNKLEKFKRLPQKETKHVCLVQSREDKLYTELWIKISKRISYLAYSRCSVNICFLILENEGGKSMKLGRIQKCKPPTHLLSEDQEVKRSENLVNRREKRPAETGVGFRSMALEQNRCTDSPDAFTWELSFLVSSLKRKDKTRGPQQSAELSWGLT